jgi:hypothetical protein
VFGGWASPPRQAVPFSFDWNGGGGEAGAAPAPPAPPAEPQHGDDAGDRDMDHDNAAAPPDSGGVGTSFTFGAIATDTADSISVTAFAGAAGACRRTGG